MEIQGQAGLRWLSYDEPQERRRWSAWQVLFWAMLVLGVADLALALAALAWYLT